MKNFLIAFVLVFIAVSCKNGTKEEPVEAQKTETEQTTENNKDMAYQSFGEEIDDANVMSAADMKAKFEGMQVGDTVAVKFRSAVNSVCQKKGCWMRLDIGGEEEAFVKFKDYGFFMPKDIATEEVIVAGKAYVEKTSVEDLKHFAEDAGKSEAEIAAITEPKTTYAILSHGVLLPEMAEKQ
ncbi:DUF4920 domain-containing protein [Marixanthomonas spongiae]|uniref:DUF4920 domain-containing protein n=1 Tax=Marixanthomonas spongiae TaxID=2174845 RepID=A0A2U0I0B0_9FLAO|nr:DUF4920 domain-containing protein [Marixanthomonas spongiae]PVW14545.1 DUF4920 domain-containing protein [Marixanthomonas spongiae]